MVDTRAANPTGPETVTEALAFLAERGYADELTVSADGFSVPGAATLHALSTARVDYQFRFEGESNPGDEAIVLGITCAADVRGVVVSAYGPTADPAHAAVLRALSRPPVS